MNYYDTVKEKIADYIVREPVEETEEVISAYTLFSILKNYNKRLRLTKGKGKCLLDKVNTFYPQKVVKKKGKFFKKKTKENFFDGIRYDIGDNYAQIELDRGYHGYVHLNKDFDDSDVYSERNRTLDEEAYNGCICDIEDILDELECVGKLFSEEKKSSGHKNSEVTDSTICNTIHCEGFDIKIKFDRWPIRFDYSISINKDFDPKGNSNMHYYDQENSLNQVIEENKEAILRNTPINLGDLSYMFCMLVLDYKNKENEKKIKKEIDQEFQKLYKKNKTN